MTQKSKELKDASEADINKVKKLLQDDIAAQAKAMGLKDGDKVDALPDKDKQKLGQLIGRDDQYLQQLTQAANQRMQGYQNQWVQEYRRVLGPIISEVADQKHVSVVINYTEPVLYADPSVDLTKAVIADASGKPLHLNDIPMPGPLVNITANGPASGPSTAPAK
jgi:Skp family chaperone for outer membrane proteins